MATMRLLVSYDGSAFSGFQVQPGRRTVQGELERALAVLSGGEVRAVGAGRTDAGVHATGQVVSCERPREMDDDRIVSALARLLPPDVAVLDAAAAPDGFHARHDARARSYDYLLWAHRAPHAIMRRYAAWYPRPLDEAALAEALRVVVGTHDFSSFGRLRPDQEPRRTILRASVQRDGALVRVTVAGHSFLHQMVRSLVGSALEVAAGRRDVAWMAAALDARSREAAGPVAPACGLTLTGVEYDLPSWGRRGEAWPAALVARAS